MDGLNPILVIAVIMYIIMDITLLRSLIIGLLLF